MEQDWRGELQSGVQFVVLVQKNAGFAPALPQKEGGLHNQSWVIWSLTERSKTSPMMFLNSLK